MTKKPKLPYFIETYLQGRLKLCLAIAIPAFILATALIRHMQVTTIDSFVRETAPQDYELYLILMSLGAAILLILGFVLTCFAVVIWCNVKLIPLSSMHRSLAQYGELWEQLNTLNAISPNLHKDYLLNNPVEISGGEFIVIAYFSHVFIAPLYALKWAYLALVISNSRYEGSANYLIKFHFNTDDVCEKRICTKEDGIRLLKTIKQLNPDTEVGHNRTSPDSQQDIRRYFLGLLGDDD